MYYITHQLYLSLAKEGEKEARSKSMILETPITTPFPVEVVSKTQHHRADKIFEDDDP